LKANCDAYGSNVRAFNLGVSDEPKTATFTFYEKSSVFSASMPMKRWTVKPFERWSETR
jgi:hypothetical protein